MPALRIQLNSLTGLRFFAALAVVLYHLHLYFPAISEGLAIFGYGYTGVSFFFILSGFVLTWSHRTEVGAGRFYWNRIARIWPLHVLTMILAIWAPPLSGSSSTGWSAAPFVLTLTHAWIPGSGSLSAFNGVSWSLSCEAFFYLLFPLLFRRLSARGRLAGIAGTVLACSIFIGIVLSIYLSIPVANYLLGTMPLYRMAEFVLGICLALMMKRGWRPPLRLLHAVGLTALLAVGVFAASITFQGAPGTLPVIYADLIMVPGFLALIAAATRHDLSGTSTLLGCKTVVRLGQWSFALYLVHELVIRLVRPFLAGTTIYGTVGAAVFAVVASIVFSGLLHEFVEKPAERRLRSSFTRVKWPYAVRSGPENS